MTSLKPYLIRAIYEWIVDNQLTPHILADAENPDAVLPMAYAEDGKIVLNIRPEAVHGLSLGNATIQFNARFAGSPMLITVPVKAVLAIYAKENGKGMIFDTEDHDDTPPPEKKPPSSSGRPKLRVVK
jgi:stringent starvation protein B